MGRWPRGWTEGEVGDLAGGADFFEVEVGVTEAELILLAGRGVVPSRREVTVDTIAEGTFLPSGGGEVRLTEVETLLTLLAGPPCSLLISSSDIDIDIEVETPS